MESELRGFVAEHRQAIPAIWQMKLRNGRGLCDLAKDRGLKYWCLNDDMDQLWKIGLLKSDQIISRRKSSRKGLQRVGTTYFGHHVYADLRILRRRSKGLGDAFKNRRELPKDFELNFHPFRYYPLLVLDQILAFGATRTQLLSSTKGMVGIASSVVDQFKAVTSSPQFYQRFGHANLVVDLAVSCEPISFGRVFGFHSEPAFNQDGGERPDTAYDKELKAYSKAHAKLLKSIGLEKIREIHTELCREAQFLDRNVDLHRILRFTARDMRIDKIRGPLGGSMYLIAMAEFIRRAAEKVFKTELPEEDESGLYGIEGTGKTHFYGAPRLIDDEKAQKNFLRQFRLDRDIRLRWYVEGETEYGAVSAVLANHPQIEIINLKGQIVAGQRKGLAFRDNLKNDIRSSVYSWVSLDGDDENYIRALKHAVDAKEFFGFIFVSEPDFELGNFEVIELAKVIIERAQLTNPAAKMSDLEPLVRGSKSNTEFFVGVRKAFPWDPQLKKDEEWGRRLFEYANRHRKRPGEKFERPIIAAIREAVSAVHTNYHYSKKDGKVDWTTGRIFYPRP